MRGIGKGQWLEPIRMKWGVYEHRGEQVMVSRSFTEGPRGTVGHWCGYIEVPNDLVDAYVNVFDVAEITYFKKETDKGCGYKFYKHYPCGLRAREGCVVIGWDYSHIGQENTTLEDILADLERAVGFLQAIKTLYPKEVA